MNITNQHVSHNVIVLKGVQISLPFFPIGLRVKIVQVQGDELSAPAEMLH